MKKRDIPKESAQPILAQGCALSTRGLSSEGCIHSKEWQDSHASRTWAIVTEPGQNQLKPTDCPTDQRQTRHGGAMPDKAHTACQAKTTVNRGLTGRCYFVGSSFSYPFPPAPVSPLPLPDRERIGERPTAIEPSY